MPKLFKFHYPRMFNFPHLCLKQHAAKPHGAGPQVHGAPAQPAAQPYGVGPQGHGAPAQPSLSLTALPLSLMALVFKFTALSLNLQLILTALPHSLTLRLSFFPFLILLLLDKLP
ncbi:hypothetical protein DPMN_180073 [Dreissena polymorpha]|uniref:Uncharacterized protein n=1 Tax=Dreissena polymorpha TaxID=45954 RepID=A0A9D4EG88_DREPO|nr:hypothetical protein DPMN_180073 [Dreissena polymorpha]